MSGDITDCLTLKNNISNMKNQNKHFQNIGNTVGITDVSSNWTTTINPVYTYSYTNYRVYDTPEVHVTINKHRQKMYNDKVYIKNGADFELEIFNKESETIYVGISIEGSEEPSKLIIKPGERVFIERHIEDNKKLNFSTYSIDSNNKNVDKAIANNGLVQLYFYIEDKPSWGSQNIGYVNTGTWVGNTGSVTIAYDTDNASFICDTANTLNIGGNATMTMDWFENNLKSALDTKETGKIEKGDYSNQHFDKKYLDINLYYIGMTTIKLMPESEQQVTKTYCTGCGVKQRKSSWKFCPSCGKAY